MARILIAQHTTDPDPIRVGVGGRVEWQCDPVEMRRYGITGFEITNVTCLASCAGATPPALFNPAPPYQGTPGGAANSGQVQANALGHVYKTTITLNRAGNLPPIVIDPHIIVDR